jgi:hypothetical protein
MLHGRSNLRTCYLAGPAKRCVLGEDASGMRIATLLLRRGGLRASFGYRSRLVFEIATATVSWCATTDRDPDRPVFALAGI